MLLTSGQISVAISSSVGTLPPPQSPKNPPTNSKPPVFIFTTLLFLSGYILQQQTVHSLQAALHPILPSPVPTTNPVLAKHFGQPPGFYDKFLSSNRPKGGWAKVAHVQLVRNHHEVCAAVMMMRELGLGESMAQRIVMYPREWDEEEGRVAEISRRLLRKAAGESKTMLVEIEGMKQVEGAEGKLTDEERFPLLNVLSLMHYNRIMVLRQPGLILDVTPLDLLFTLPMEKPMLGLSDPQDESRKPVILLFEPSEEMYQEIASTLPEGAYLDEEFLQKVSVEHAPEDPEKSLHLLATTGLLGDEKADSFVKEDLMDMTAYVHIDDPGLPGPQYDVPRQTFVNAMPKGKEARKGWEMVYERFRDSRMNVCGLDLEPITAPEEKDTSTRVEDLTH
ncbi:hypothetical protein ACLMJK_002957 [Lecanora helva]